LATVFLALVVSDSWSQVLGQKTYSTIGARTSQNYNKVNGWVEGMLFGFNEVDGQTQNVFPARNAHPISQQMVVSATLTVAKGNFEFTLFNGDGSVAAVLISSEGQSIAKKFEVNCLGQDFKYQIRAQEANNVMLSLEFRTR
jgi:hypothetical protein